MFAQRSPLFLGCWTSEKHGKRCSELHRVTLHFPLEWQLFNLAGDIFAFRLRQPSDHRSCSFHSLRKGDLFLTADTVLGLCLCKEAVENPGKRRNPSKASDSTLEDTFCRRSLIQKRKKICKIRTTPKRCDV